MGINDARIQAGVCEADMRTIEEEWQNFSDRILPEDCSPVQIQEMRRAFFCGVEIALILMSEIGSHDEDRAVEELEDLHRQCRYFAEQISIGTA